VILGADEPAMTLATCPAGGLDQSLSDVGVLENAEQRGALPGGFVALLAVVIDQLVARRATAAVRG